MSQSSFEEILSRLLPDAVELRIGQSLDGDINMANLKKFPNVHTVVFVEGTLTTVSHIPEGIQYIYCENNQLTNIELPSTVLKAYLKQNEIESLSLKNLPQLHTLEISDNPVSTLELTSSLVELYCERASLSILNMENMPLLRTFYCSGNRFPLELVHCPIETLVQTRFPNKYKYGKGIHVSVEYQDKVKAFFYYKKTYENKWKNYVEKKAQGKVKQPGCVMPCCKNSKKIGKMTFLTTNDQYIIRCTSDTPCDQRFSRTLYASVSDLLEIAQEDKQEYQEKILELRMQSVFKHMENDKVIKLVDDVSAAYKANLDLLDKYTKEKDDLYHKSPAIATAQSNIQELLYVLQDLDAPTDIVAVQQKIFNESEKVMGLIYGSKEVIATDDGWHVCLDEVDYASTEMPVISKANLSKDDLKGPLPKVAKDPLPKVAKDPLPKVAKDPLPKDNKRH